MTSWSKSVKTSFASRVALAPWMWGALNRDRPLPSAKLSPVFSDPAPLGGALILIVGAPRSGASWLGKIFDSHPSVLYRHEPDTLLRNAVLPALCGKLEANIYRDLARDYLARLVTTRALKSAGSLPVFVKEFRGPAQHLLRKGLIYGLHALNLWTRSDILQRLPIPDFVDRGCERDLAMVIKSVSMCGRIGLIAETAPASRIVFILRHPCGQVASMVREHRLGKFHTPPFMEELVRTELYAQFGLRYTELATKPALEQYAWHWALLCQTTLDSLRGRSNVRIVHYEDLCVRPMATVAELFAFAGLPGNERTDAFLKTSWKGNRIERFLGVQGNIGRIVDRWRSELSSTDQDRIIAIARKFEVGRLCLT